MLDRLHEALVYKAHGLHPIAFYPHSKTPAFEAGAIQQYRAKVPTTFQLREMFRDPARNVGVITGAGGLTVLDIDGAEGQASIRRCGEVPETPMVQTSDPDHFHAYFRSNQEIPTRIKVLPGVDIIGTDWQVLAPSSVHPDGPIYHWQTGHGLSDVELAPPPKWLLELAALAPEHHEEANAGCNGNLGASNQKSRLLALSGRLLAPTDLSAYGGWPQILSNELVNLSCARYLGLLDVEVGKRFVCRLPGHSDMRTGARLYWNVKSELASMTLKYCDNHYESGEFWYSLPDVFASCNYGEVRRLSGVETTVWQLRLLIAAAVLLPYPVRAKSLPSDVPRHIKQLYNGFLDLLRAKWLHTPGEPTPFTWRFAAAWCGMHSAGSIVKGMQWLLKRGVSETRRLPSAGAWAQDDVVSPCEYVGGQCMDYEPGEYDQDADEHGALRAIETQLRTLGPMLAEAITDHAGCLANAIDQHSEATRQVADALNRLADILGGVAQTWRGTLP